MPSLWRSAPMQVFTICNKVLARFGGTLVGMVLHPGRWTAGTYSHHPFLERKMICTKPPWWRVSVNLHGVLLDFVTLSPILHGSVEKLGPSIFKGRIPIGGTHGTHWTHFGGRKSTFLVQGHVDPKKRTKSLLNVQLKHEISSNISHYYIWWPEKYDKSNSKRIIQCNWLLIDLVRSNERSLDLPGSLKILRRFFYLLKL